jgi:hypothetical protein
MAWRSSFGAIVLLALVALHPSTAAPLRSMLKMMLGSVGMMTGEKTLKTMEPSFSSEMYKLFKESDTRCSRYFFALVMEWRNSMLRNSRFDIVAKDGLKLDISKALDGWRDTCYSRLEDEIQSELKTMSESAREQFKLFVKQDKRDLESKDKSFAIFSPAANSAIVKLRRLIGSPDGTASADQMNAAETFVGACDELTASRSIMRDNYARKTPASQRPYFPHIRFYDDCRRLLGLLKHGVEDPFKRAEAVKIFGEKLDKILVKGWCFADPEAKWSETAESDGERERSVAKAAYRFASIYREDIEGRLEFLKGSCSKAVADADDTIWLHLHLNLLRRKLSDQQILVIKRYSRYLEACKQLGKLEKEQIIKKATEKRGYNLPKLSTCFGCSSAKTNRR